MRRRLVATLALAVLALAAVLVAWRLGVSGRSHVGVPAGDPAALLRGLPFFRSVIPASAVRSASRSTDGTLHLDLAPHVLVAARLQEHDLAGLAEALPPRAIGTIKMAGASASIEAETWHLDDAALFALLDRAPSEGPASMLWSTIPGRPSAVAAARIVPSHMAEPDFGGVALDAWRSRADLAERVLGRPLRAELAEDLGGLALFALYEPPPGGAPDALFAVELKRSDRLRSLFDTVFALGALTDRASIERYRDVPVGLFRPGAAGGRFALAIDGNAVFLARSPRLIHEAIDAHRTAAPGSPLVSRARDLAASWCALTESAYVAHGWARLAREAEPAGSLRAESVLVADVPSGWRLIGKGPGPAITADPVVPFVRGVLARAQRGAD